MIVTRTNMIAPEFDIRRLRQPDPRLSSLSFCFSCTEKSRSSNIPDLEEALEKNTSLNNLTIFPDSSFAPTPPVAVCQY